MKINTFFKPFGVIVLSLGLWACGERDEKSPETKPDEAAGTETTQDKPAAVESATLDAAERAEMLGIAGRLSADVEFFASIYDGKDAVQKLRGLKAWEWAQKVAKEEEGTDLEAEIGEQGKLAGQILGEEFFVAFGEGSAASLDFLNEVNEISYYQQFRMLGKAFAKAAVEGDFSMLMMEFMMAAGEKTAFGEGMEKLLPQLEAYEVSPVLAGLKISDKETRGMVEQQIRSMMAMLEGGEMIEFESNGAKFSGLLFKGEILVESMEADRAEMDAMLGEEATERMLKAIREKQIIVALGNMDDYLLAYVGAKPEQCPLVESVDDSLAAREQLNFVDAYHEQDVYGVLFGEEAFIDSIPRGGIGNLAAGIRDGINGVEGFGDTRELVALLNLIGEREENLLKLVTTDTLGGVIRVDDGLYLELFGGGSSGRFDFESPHQFSGLENGAEVLLFANWKTNPDYADASEDYIEALVETAYAMTAHVAQLDVEESQLKEFKASFGLFDQLLKKDLVKAWNAFEAMSGGLGHEAAIVVDLAAEFPPIPGVPPAFVGESRFVRTSYLAPVTDRSKVSESWTELDGSLRGIFQSLSEAQLADISMLKPTSSEKDGLTTWYFDAFAFSDDLKPSVTLNDELFIASSSRTQALDLAAAVKSDAAQDRRGFWLRFDMDVLRKYLNEMLTTADKKGELLMPDENDLAEFREELPTIREAIGTLEDIKEITIHDRMEAGRRRVTLHVAKP